jgi:hypothetical protein
MAVKLHFNPIALDSSTTKLRLMVDEHNFRRRGARVTMGVSGLIRLKLRYIEDRVLDHITSWARC